MGMAAGIAGQQSAMEYLLTYGWAILVISIVLSAFLYLGVFNSGTFVNSQCIAQADFSCLTAQMTPNGQITFNVQQNTMTNINVTAVACNATVSYAGMQSLSPQASMSIGSNRTFSGLQCYTSKGAAFSGSVGTVYTGYIIMNYTNVQSGFLHTEYITVVEKIT